MSDNNTAVIEFEREAKYRIGAVTYLVTAHFDESGETLKEKMQQLLCERITKEAAANK